MLKAMNTYQTIESQITNANVSDVLGLVQLKQRCYNLAASQSDIANAEWWKLHKEVDQRLEFAGATVIGLAVKLENSFYKLSRQPIPLNKITEYPMSVYENHFRAVGASKHEILRELETMDDGVIRMEEVPTSWLSALNKERDRNHRRK